MRDESPSKSNHNDNIHSCSSPDIEKNLGSRASLICCCFFEESVKIVFLNHPNHVRLFAGDIRSPDCRLSQTRTSQNPGQVIRYCRHAEARPLWVHKADQLAPSASASVAAASADGGGAGSSSVPPCAKCGAPRVFEMQVCVSGFRLRVQLYTHISTSVMRSSHAHASTATQVLALFLL